MSNENAGPKTRHGYHRIPEGFRHSIREPIRNQPLNGITDAIRWDEFYMALSATTINENGKHWQYAVRRRVVQRSSTLLVLESPRMSLTRDALWHNGL
jgi:hypothetical protein